jgi:tRNA G18 (ribose-2'-O)-methylase SpoU
MIHQLTHQENKFTQKAFEITVICDHLESPANQGALFRICEAFGVKEIIFFGNAIHINSSRLKRTARNTQTLVPFRSVMDVNDVVNTFKEKHTPLIGLEITEGSQAIGELKFANNKNVALFIGSEKNGISSSLLAQMDQVYHIPMYGTNSSMNVVQSAGIALYSITSLLAD